MIDARQQVEHPIIHSLCPCAPCQQWRASPDLSWGRVICFGEMMDSSNTGGHGLCVDPWGQGCVCTGTAADGECEGCWLWLK